MLYRRNRAVGADPQFSYVWSPGGIPEVRWRGDYLGDLVDIDGVPHLFTPEAGSVPEPLRCNTAAWLLERVAEERRIEAAKRQQRRLRRRLTCLASMVRRRRVGP